MAILNTGEWAHAGPLGPGLSDTWFQPLPQGRVKWFIAYNNNNPGLTHQLEITSVTTKRMPSGEQRVLVTVKNIGTEPGFYKIYAAEAI